MKTNLLYLIVFAIFSSCGSADYTTKIEEIKEVPEVAPASVENVPKRAELKAKFIAFNNVDEL